jgi:hypothetical protein
MIRPLCFLWDDPLLMPQFTFWQDLHLCLTDCNHNIPPFNHGIRSDKTPKQDRQQPHLQKDGRAHKIIKLILTLSTWDVQTTVTSLHLTRLEPICGFTNLCKGSMFTGQHVQCDNMSISPVEYIQHAGLIKNIHTLESKYNIQCLNPCTVLNLTCLCNSVLHLLAEPMMTCRISLTLTMLCEVCQYSPRSNYRSFSVWWRSWYQRRSEAIKRDTKFVLTWTLLSPLHFM